MTRIKHFLLTLSLIGTQVCMAQNGTVRCILQKEDDATDSITANRKDVHYIIRHDINLEGATLTVGPRCILDFQGGSLHNGRLKLSGTKINGRGTLFGPDLEFDENSTLDEHTLRAEWFGIDGNDEVDDTENINRALRGCHHSGVRNLEFNRGRYIVSDTVHVAGGTMKHWHIRIKGVGSNQQAGTVFSMRENAVFKVDMNHTIPNGQHRAGGIYDCCFINSAYGTRPVFAGRGILLNYAHQYEIKNCYFLYLQHAITLTGHAYYTHIQGCDFALCNYAIHTLKPGDSHYQEGNTNNNMVSGCWIDKCPHPIDLPTGGGWHIYDSNLEDGNGTCYLGNNNRMTNVRIERNDLNKPWLELGNMCTVDADMHAAGSANAMNWRCIVRGNDNRVRLKFHFLHPRGILSYGKQNTFDITTNNRRPNNEPTYLIHDPEDHVTINGYSNHANYDARNEVEKVSNLSLDTEHDISHRGSIHYPIQAGSRPILHFYKDTELGNEYYTTCEFYFQDTRQSMPDTLVTIPLLGGIRMNHTTKWFGLTAAWRNTIQAWTGKPQVLCHNLKEGERLYVTDIIVSAKGLFPTTKEVGHAY